MPNALPSPLLFSSSSLPLVAGLCEGHYRNALVQAAQLAIAVALYTCLWHSTFLQLQRQYAVSTLRGERVSVSCNHSTICLKTYS